MNPAIKETIYQCDKKYNQDVIEGISPWHLIRIAVMNYLTERSTDTVMTTESKQPKRSKKEKLKFLFSLILRNPFFSFKKAPVLIFSSGVVIIEHRGKWINRMYDSYRNYTPDDILLVEQSHNNFFPPGRFSTGVKSQDLLSLMIKLKKKFSKCSSETCEAINNFLKNLQNHLGIDDETFLKKLENTLKDFYSVKKFSVRLYKKLIKKTRARQVFIEDASYGGSLAIILACRELGVTPAEFQHGLISTHHLAYNWHRDYYTPNKALFIDEIFLYGDYYREKISLPAKKIIAGSPFLNEMNISSPVQGNKKRILLCSQGPVYELFNEAINNLLHLGDEYEIIHKPHPGEFKTLEEKYDYKKGKNTKIILSKENVYELIMKSDIIIGCYSTVLYECLAFKKTPIVLDHQFARENLDLSLFTVCQKVSELSSLLESAENSNENPRFRYLWEPETAVIWKNFVKALKN